MSRFRIVHDDRHGEVYLVDQGGEEVAECCGAYFHEGDWRHEPWCDEYEEDNDAPEEET